MKFQSKAYVDFSEESKFALIFNLLDYPGNHLTVRLTTQTSISIIGTSISTPTTVANEAPEFIPKSVIATATANSKKLEVPIRQAGPAML